MLRSRLPYLLAALLCIGGALVAPPAPAAAALPEAHFTAAPTSGVAPLVVQFTDQSTNGPTSWSWDFGDGSTSSEQNPSHTYETEGSYAVVLGVANASGTAVLVQADFITATGAPTEAPVASFTREPASGIVPLTVQFTDASTNSPTAWAWDFGDGATSSLQNPTHQYTTAGEYTVVLAASNALGTSTKVWADCVAAGTASPPVVDFKAQPQTGLVPLMVAFTDTSTNAPASWDWTFGDGGSSTDRNPTHIYTKGGSYTVTLTAANSYGSASATKPGFISVDSGEPRTDFVATPTSGLPPLTVRFTDISTNRPTIWVWELGDGTVARGPTAEHTYTALGSYTVSLTTWGEGEPETVTKTNLIVVSEPPEANFGADPLRGPAPLLVRFTDLSTNQPSSWLWEFGDGATSAARSPSHEFALPDDYVVKLTVTNSVGVATAKRIVTATRAEATNFSGTPTSGVVPLAVEFTDLSENSPTFWGWDFGDGGTDTSRNPGHSYCTPGRYTVSLTTVGGGRTDTLARDRYILATFTDVPVGYWAMSEVLSCVEAGIVIGYRDGSYHPVEVLTRAPMAVYLARALAGGPVPNGPAIPSFADVPREHWAFEYVEYVKARDVVRGYPDGYHPDEPVNRAQMAVYVSRAMAGGDAAVPGFTGPPSFDDVTPYNDWAWALKYVEYAHSGGIIGGFWDGAYHPEYQVTRDQMAVYLARAFGLE